MPHKCVWFSSRNICLWRTGVIVFCKEHMSLAEKWFHENNRYYFRRWHTTAWIMFLKHSLSTICVMKSNVIPVGVVSSHSLIPNRDRLVLMYCLNCNRPLNRTKDSFTLTSFPGWYTFLRLSRSKSKSGWTSCNLSLFSSFGS